MGLFESKAVQHRSVYCNRHVGLEREGGPAPMCFRERNQSYVITCRMSGCSELRIVFRHIIPNILPHLLVLYSTGLSSIIIMISSYAFLGLGLETGTAGGRAMFINANKLMFSHPQFLVYPGLCILFAAAGFNLFGEALRDICAPKGGIAMLTVTNLSIRTKQTKGNPYCAPSASP